MTQKTSRRRFLMATAATGAIAGLNVAVLARTNGQHGEVILLGGETSGWLGYRVPGQSGSQPSQNSTLNLQAGTTYTLMWKNVDGVGHNFAIQDSDGNNLQVLQPVNVEQDVFEQVNETDANESVSLQLSDGNVTGVSTGNETTTAADGNESGDGMGQETTTAAEGQQVEKTEIISEQGAVQGVRFTASSEMAQYICLVHPNSMVGEISVEGGDGATGNESDGNSS